MSYLFIIKMKTGEKYKRKSFKLVTVHLIRLVLNVKLSLCLTKHYADAYGGVDV
jgi:hypothetical protein